MPIARRSLVLIPLGLLVMGGVYASLVLRSTPGPGTVLAQPDTTPPDTTSDEPTTEREVPWPLKLGAKVQSVRATIPVVDRVVLVKDEASFDAAIRQWSLEGRWPILFDDDSRFTTMFLRRFRPAEVLTLSVDAPADVFGEDDPRALASHARTSAARTWWKLSDRPEGEIDLATLKTQWERVSWEPPGVVITSIEDPAWPAAVALAAGWGQPLEFIRGSFGQSDGTLNTAGFSRLNRLVNDSVERTGFDYDTLGDAIDTVTLVREMSPKYRPTDDSKDQLAITDGLCRSEDTGAPWAMTGWIFGPRDRAVYMAMCSLFLDPPSEATLFNSYPIDEASWGTYAMDESAALMRRVDVNVAHAQRPHAGVAAWLRLGVVDDGLIYVNTKGNATWFDLGDGRCFASEVPVLHRPAAVHFIHSWSTNMPGRDSTIAGQWLDHGAFAYVGSVHEPYLQAFVPPSLVSARLLASAPFLVAARRLESNTPWKIATIGDPLYTPFAPALRRVSPDSVALSSSGAVSVEVTEREDTSLESRMSELLIARRALSALDAFMSTRDPSSRAVDLAWAAAYVADDELGLREVRVLMANVRAPYEFADAVRLSPHVRRTMGNDAVDAWLDLIEAKTTDRYGKKMINGAR